MANAYDPKVAFDQRGQIEGEMIESQETMAGEVHDKTHVQSAREALKYFIQTYITFNKGGKWHQLKAPERDSAGKKYDCGEYCFLNLHGSSIKTAGYYSFEKAVGIILGNGNVGKYLSHSTEEISTFLSRDGGFTWIEVKIL